MRYYPITLLMIIGLFGCQAERTEEHPAFLGNWFGREANCSYRLEVYDNNTAVYRDQCGAPNEVKAGFKVAAEGTQVRIGSKRLEIVEYPFETLLTDTGSFWEMNLEDVTYTTFK